MSDKMAGRKAIAMAVFLGKSVMFDNDSSDGEDEAIQSTDKGKIVKVRDYVEDLVPSMNDATLKKYNK